MELKEAGLTEIMQRIMMQAENAVVHIKQPPFTHKKCHFYFL